MNIISQMDSRLLTEIAEYEFSIVLGSTNVQHTMSYASNL